MRMDSNNPAVDNPVQPRLPTASLAKRRRGLLPTVLQRRTGLIVVLTGLMLIGGSQALAQEGQASKRLRNQAEFAAVATSGNSDMRTLSFKNRLEYDFSDRVMGTWDLSALYGRQDGQKNAERYTTDLRADYSLDGPVYLFVMGGWLQDEFAGFNNRYYIGPGVGRSFMDGPYHYLKGEVGLNWAREEYVGADSEDFLEGRGFGLYEYAFSDRSRFLQSLEYLQDFNDTDNFKIISHTAVTAALTRLIAIRIGYEIRYQNRPITSDIKETDTILSASLVFNY
jgi:putative salt-induced outer membrane protein